jgi:hypothetical protein
MRPQFRGMKRVLLILVLLSALLDTSAQGLMERKHPEIFPLNGQMRRGGFYFAPGVTYTLTRFKDKEEDKSQFGDTAYYAIYHPKGGFGLYLEAGWFLATRDPVIIDYWDVGLAYKQLRGSESFSGSFAYGDSIRDWVSDASFNDKYATFHLNANKFFHVADYRFIQATLGANVDYRFAASREFSGFPGVAPHEFPPELIGQAHFKLGYGMKVTKRLLIIPAIETPIFSVVPGDEGRIGRLQWFNSLYRPLILSVRFLFLRYPKGWACPPVKGNEFEKHKVVNPSYERH